MLTRLISKQFRNHTTPTSKTTTSSKKPDTPHANNNTSSRTAHLPQKAASIVRKVEVRTRWKYCSVHECLNQKMLSLHKNGIILNPIMEYKDHHILRLIHFDNLEDTLKNGMYSKNSGYSELHQHRRHNAH